MDQDELDQSRARDDGAWRIAVDLGHVEAQGQCERLRGLAVPPRHQQQRGQRRQERLAPGRLEVKPSAREERVRPSLPDAKHEALIAASGLDQID
jgi:hypothetical protein